MKSISVKNFSIAFSDAVNTTLKTAPKLLKAAALDTVLKRYGADIKPEEKQSFGTTLAEFNEGSRYMGAGMSGFFLTMGVALMDPAAIGLAAVIYTAMVAAPAMYRIGNVQKAEAQFKPS
jgi:hypothetical protein